MSISTGRAMPAHHRPASVKTATGLLLFLGISAIAGGTAMVLDPGGAAPPVEWLDDIPVVDGWTLPGLVLGVGFGLGSLLTAYGVLRRPRWAWARPIERIVGHHWSWPATLGLGLGQVAWIALELAYLPQLSALQAIYGGVGLALLLLSLHPAVRHDLVLPTADGPSMLGGPFGPARQHPSG
jgi:hypothetical protein